MAHNYPYTTILIQRGLATYSSLDLLSPWLSRQTISHCLEFIIDMLFLGLSPSKQNEQADTLLGFLPPRRTTPTVTWWHDNDTAIHLWYQQITQNHLWIKPDVFVLSHYMWLYKSLPRVMVSISLLCQKYAVSSFVQLLPGLIGKGFVGNIVHSPPSR